MGRILTFWQELGAFLLILITVQVSAIHWRLLECLLLASLDGRRETVYPAVVGLEGSLLGFTIAAYTIALGFARDRRLQILRDSRHWPGFYEAFARSVRWTAIATIVSVLALLIDRQSSQVLFLVVTFYLGLAASAVALTRTFWVLHGLGRIITSDASRAAGE